MTGQQPIEVMRASAARAHASAAQTFDQVGANLMRGGARSDAMYELTEALAIARDELGLLARYLEEAAPPARPLEAVLADIVAEGHGNVEVYRRASSPRWIAKSDNGSVRFPGVEAGGERIDAYYVAVEHGDAEIDGGDPANAVAAAEARLADIRKLHAAAVAAVERDAAVDAEAMLDAYPAAFQGRVVCFAIAPGVSACGKDYEAITEVIDNVTCPACLEWIARREAEASESGEEA